MSADFAGLGAGGRPEESFADFSSTLGGDEAHPLPTAGQFPPFTSYFIAVVGGYWGDEGKGRAIPDLKLALAQITDTSNPIAMVLKVNGGRNSGHTTAGVKLNLIPSGVVDNSIDIIALGRSVVADPFALRWEMAALEQHFSAIGADTKVAKRLVIDSRCMLSDFTHRIRDIGKEVLRIARGEAPRGTTSMGISPAFADEAQQEQIFYEIFQDALDPDLTVRAKEEFTRMMRNRIQQCQLELASWFRHFEGKELPTDLGLGDRIRPTDVSTVAPDGTVTKFPSTWSLIFQKIAERDLKNLSTQIDSRVIDRAQVDIRNYLTQDPFGIDAGKVVEDYWKLGMDLARRVRIQDVGELALAYAEEGRYVVGEFGQSVWLDVKRGYPPNVTASRTWPAEMNVSLGIPENLPRHAMSVVKAYGTAVGTHFMPTLVPTDSFWYQKLAPLEFGTTTGRQRMIVWFDAVAIGQGLRDGGFQDLMINKLDALSLRGAKSDEPLKVCTHYATKRGQAIHRLPSSALQRSFLTPCYREFQPWNEDISQVRDFRNLPRAAQLYIAGLYAATVRVANYRTPEVPSVLPNIRFIGVGPGPSQVILHGIPAPLELLAIDKEAQAQH